MRRRWPRRNPIAYLSRESQSSDFKVLPEDGSYLAKRLAFKSREDPKPGQIAGVYDEALGLSFDLAQYLKSHTTDEASNRLKALARSNMNELVALTAYHLTLMDEGSYLSQLERVLKPWDQAIDNCPRKPEDFAMNIDGLAKFNPGLRQFLGAVASTVGHFYIDNRISYGGEELIMCAPDLTERAHQIPQAEISESDLGLWKLTYYSISE